MKVYFIVSGKTSVYYIKSKNSGRINGPIVSRMDLRTHRHKSQWSHITDALQAIVYLHQPIWVTLQPLLAERGAPSNLGCDLDARMVYWRNHLAA